LHTELTEEQIREYLDTLKPDAPWGATIRFLDTIDSLAHLDQLAKVAVGQEYVQLISRCYRKNLERWPDPQLPEGFQEACPLLTARLNTPAKIRVLLRGADFRGVTPLLMGEVLEAIIRRHELKGEQKVVYPRYRGNQRCDALRIVYHSQMQAWTLTRLAFPEHTCTGAGTNGLYVDWRSKEEREAEKRTVRNRGQSHA
jgi:hypothetical protein